MSELLTAALAYGLAGVAVLPLHSAPGGRCSCVRGRGCPSPGKHPRTPEGKDDASTEPSVIGRWWERWPDANIGLVVPDGFAVVDVDDPAAMRGVPLPPTLVARTARGGHYWYRVNGVPPAPRPGADVRLAGRHYVVAPPSLHASGARYEWIEGRFSLELAVDLPDAWLAPPPGDAPREAFTLPPVIEQGARHRTLIAYAGRLRADLDDGALVRAALADANAQRCRPPLAAAELDALVDDALRRWRPEPRVILDLREEPEPEGDRTLAERLGVSRIGDMPTARPAPLEGALLAPGEHNIWFGPGDTGKGVLAAWLAGQRDSATLVLDYEAHPREWARRLQRFGGGDVWYLAPHTTPLLAGPLWKRASVIADLARELDIGLLLIDSISLACAGADVLDPATVTLYAAGLQRIGRTALSLGHVTKTDERWARYPFGSVMWHNTARVTWAAEKMADEPHTVELRCRKHNDYPPQPGHLFTIEWDRDGPVSVTHETASRKLIDRIMDVLADGAWHTTAAIAAAASDDGGEPVAETQAYALLKRYRERGRVESSKGRPVTWRRVGVTVDLGAD